MYYDKRNRAALAELAPNTKKAANKWYDYLIKNKIEVLIYDARRTEAEQRANVASGASQTMKSYHLVGQALDFVPANSKGGVDWGGYGRADIKKALAEAKRLGFEWGGDWRGFVDKPHLQYNYKGYGTDKTLSSDSAPKPSTPPKESNDSYKIVRGDTLSGIAKKFGASINDLKSWNKLKSDDINAGDSLKVKKPVASGDGKAIVPYPDKVLEIGSTGKDVERVQRAVGAEVTGNYSAGTKNKVVAYQKRKGLKETGKVDLATWNMLF